MIAKDDIRRTIRQRFLDSTDSERKLWSEELCKKLIEDEHIKNAQYIMAYYPLKDEVNILPLLESLINIGKTILLPEVVSAEDIVLHVYDTNAKMSKGTLGTSFPSNVEFTDYELIDAVLTPGVAFTKDGHRLGRGRGYYDRFLKKLEGVYKIGVCFSYQIMESIPTETHDIKVDYV